MPTIEADYSTLTRYESLTDAPEVLLVDIDGTAALRRERGRGPYDETRVGEDLPNEAVLRVVRALVAVTGCKVIFMSARSEGCREATEVWLAKHYGLRYEKLLMRAAGDGRRDWVVKSELFDEHIRYGYRVIAVFDDRNQVVRMWRALGLTVFQVADGDF
jgi:hypothetical protein